MLPLACCGQQGEAAPRPLSEQPGTIAGLPAAPLPALLHWTASPDRVGRDLRRYKKDRTERAREVLIAEIGSALLCADLGIVPELEPRPDHAAYVGSWLKVLADDKRAIFQAATHAQRAASYLHSLQPAASEDREAA